MLIAYTASGAFAAAASYGALSPAGPTALGESANEQSSAPEIGDELLYWRRWDRGMLRFVVTGIAFSFAAVAVGIAWVALSQRWEWDGHGAPVQLIDGLTYGFLAGFLLRVPFEGPGTEVVAPARGLIGLYIRRAGPFLTRGADTNVRRRVGDLKPDELCVLDFELFLRYEEPRLKPWVVAEHVQAILELHALVRGRPRAGDTLAEAAVSLAIGRLRNRCVRLIVKHRTSAIELPQPSVPKRA